MTLKDERGFLVTRPADFRRNALWVKRLAAAMEQVRKARR